MGFCILEENGVRHDVQRALGHAHHINTIERMGEAVVIDCPANCLQPYLQHDNWWDQGQLFFTPGQVWGIAALLCAADDCPAYQPLCVAAAVTQEADTLDVTVTRSEDGQKLVLKVVNLSADDVGVSVSGLPWLCRAHAPDPAGRRFDRREHPRRAAQDSAGGTGMCLGGRRF